MSRLDFQVTLQSRQTSPLFSRSLELYLFRVVLSLCVQQANIQQLTNVRPRLQIKDRDKKKLKQQQFLMKTQLTVGVFADRKLNTVQQENFKHLNPV